MFSTILQIQLKINDTIVELTDSIWQTLPPNIRTELANNATPSNYDIFMDYIVPALFIAGFGAFSFALASVKEKTDNYFIEKYKLRRLHETKKAFVYEGADLDLDVNAIHTILQKRFPYFILLSNDLKEAFAKRVFAFIKSKTFIIRTEEVYKEMPVLISAAAIQLTFGLKSFKMPFYKYIQVHKEEYCNPGESKRKLLGHVHRQTISVAWNHLYNGIAIPDNGENLGLHEMAHALYIQNVFARSMVESKDFKIIFNKLEASAEMHYSLTYCMYDLYTSNAYKSKQEFWADSIELFFERPDDLYKCYPTIFNHLVILLNQDPRNKENPLVTNAGNAIA